jgi:hypothetical protein
VQVAEVRLLVGHIDLLVVHHVCQRPPVCHERERD